MPEDRNERREIRILCHINVLFCLNNENLYGTCMNLGMHGMFIGYEGDVQIGELVELSFMVSGPSSSLVEAGGRVVWVNCGAERRNPELPEGFGVEFIEVPAESRVLIRNFIDQCN